MSQGRAVIQTVASLPAGAMNPCSFVVMGMGVFKVNKHMYIYMQINTYLFAESL